MLHWIKFRQELRKAQRLALAAQADAEAEVRDINEKFDEEIKEFEQRRDAQIGDGTNVDIHIVDALKRERRTIEQNRQTAVQHAKWFNGRVGDDAIRLVHTKYLLQQAQDLIVPAPPRDDDDLWEETLDYRKVLTTKGINHMRSLVRKERMERAQHWGFWISMAIGLVGALSGLVAVISQT